MSAKTKRNRGSSGLANKPLDLKRLKPGDQFSYKNIGYGLVSYEDGSDAIGIKNGRLFTDTFDKVGMEWNGKTWVFNGGLGMTTEIASIEELRKYEAEQRN